MNAEQIIRERLSAHLTLTHLDLHDTTGKHIHHQNFDGGLHICLLYTSPRPRDRG